MKSQSENEVCPLSQAALLLQSKWDFIVINNLLSGTLTFLEIKSSIEKGLLKEVPPSTVSRILKRLEKIGLLVREVDAPVGEPVKIQYSLTQMGKELKPVLKDLKAWGTRWLDQNNSNLSE